MACSLRGRMASLAVAVAMSLATPAWAGTPLPDSPHIVVTGSGKVSVAPDQVRVSAQFEARDPQPLAAKRSVDPRRPLSPS